MLSMQSHWERFHSVLLQYQGTSLLVTVNGENLALDVSVLGSFWYQRPSFGRTSALRSVGPAVAASRTYRHSAAMADCLDLLDCNCGDCADCGDCDCGDSASAPSNDDCACDGHYGCCFWCGPCVDDSGAWLRALNAGDLEWEKRSERFVVSVGPTAWLNITCTLS